MFTTFNSYVKKQDGLITSVWWVSLWLEMLNECKNRKRKKMFSFFFKGSVVFQYFLTMHISVGKKTKKKQNENPIKNTLLYITLYFIKAFFLKYPHFNKKIFKTFLYIFFSIQIHCQDNILFDLFPLRSLSFKLSMNLNNQKKLSLRFYSIYSFG